MPVVARTVRAAVLVEHELDYVPAAKLRNERAPYIMFREILPNVMPPILVEFTVRLGYAIFTVAGLSFLGFGIQPPSPDWGLADLRELRLLERGHVVARAVPVARDLLADHRRHAHRRWPSPRRWSRERTRHRRGSRAGPRVPRRRDGVPGPRHRPRGGARRVVRDRARRVLRPRGRVGLRQVDHRPGHRPLPARNGRITRGTIEVNGRDVNRLGESELRRYRASTVSMVYQSPGSALNPSLRVGDQLAEVFTIAGASRREARTRALEALRQVQIADPESVLRRYPHQLSGGMLQRVVIAMALATDPALLILDEPTTGLDATVEAEVLDLVSHLRERLGTSVLFISHNLGIIANMCDRVGVLYAGRLVEEGPALEVFRDPRHPYAVGLLRCLPRAGRAQGRVPARHHPGQPAAHRRAPPGCVFADRCGLVQPVCREQEPDLLPVDPTHHSRCHFWPEAHTVPRTTPAAGVAAPRRRRRTGRR